MTEHADDNRPAIPADIKRRVLVEAGHRCAIPTCRYITVEIHHIVPWSKCQTHEYENLIALCANCHGRADKGEIDRKSLKHYKFNLRFVHDKFSQLEMDALFDLYCAPPSAGLPWLPFMMIFFKRLLEAGYVEVYARQGGVWQNGVKSSPDFLLLTDSGRKFVRELGVTDLD